MVGTPTSTTTRRTVWDHGHGLNGHTRWWGSQYDDDTAKGSRARRDHGGTLDSTVTQCMGPRVLRRHMGSLDLGSSYPLTMYGFGSCGRGSDIVRTGTGSWIRGTIKVYGNTGLGTEASVRLVETGLWVTTTPTDTRTYGLDYSSF